MTNEDRDKKVNHLRKYEEIIHEFELRREEIRSDFLMDTSLIEEIIEDSFCIYNFMEEKYIKKAQESQKKLGAIESVIHILFIRNIHYFIASYELISKGLNNSSVVILRSIFETILQVYMLHYTEKEKAELFYKIETDTNIDNWKQNAKTRRKEFAAIDIRKFLYTGEKRTQIDDFYHIVSEFAVHPSIKGASGDLGYNREITEAVLYLAIRLGVSNLIAMCEIYFDEIDPQFIKQAKDLKNRSEEKIKSYIKLYPDLIPNKDEFKGKQKLKLD